MFWINAIVLVQTKLFNEIVDHLAGINDLIDPVVAAIVVDYLHGSVSSVVPQHFSHVAGVYKEGNPAFILSIFLVIVNARAKNHCADEKKNNYVFSDE